MLNRKIRALVKHIIIIYFLKEGSSSDVGNWRARHFQPGSNTLKCLGHLKLEGLARWQEGRFTYSFSFLLCPACRVTASHLTKPAA